MRGGYVEGVERMREGHWFEAHEVLELVWRPTPPGPRRDFLQGLIHVAVALEHWRRGNPRGASGQWQKAHRKLAPVAPVFDGLDVAALLADVEEYWRAVGLEAAVEAQARGGGWRMPTLPAPVPRWVDDRGPPYGE